MPTWDNGKEVDKQEAGSRSDAGNEALPGLLFAKRSVLETVEGKQQLITC